MKLPQTLIIESLDNDALLKEGLEMIRRTLCLNASENSNCDCESCKLFRKGNHPDFVRIEKPTDKKNLPISIIREEILPRIVSRPLVSKKMCILIHESQALSNGAQNALLKTLEEPPEFVHIVLLVDNTRNLLETILSRGQVKVIQSNEKSNRKPIKILKEVLDMDLIDRFNLAEQIANKDKTEKRKDALHTISFLDDLIKGLRAFMKMNLNETEICSQSLEDIKKFLDGREKIKNNVNKRLVLENIMLQTLNKTIYKKGRYV